MVDARSRRKASLRLHTTQGDKLYRWAMWRMYINEDMSRQITYWRDFYDTSASVNSVTFPYLRHPDCAKYGRIMRKRFGTEGDTMYYRNRLKLSDSQYLVYGIPRVSLNKNISTDLQTLHRSCPDFGVPFENSRDNRENEFLISSTEDNQRSGMRNENVKITEITKNQRSSMGNESDQITELFKFVSFENAPNTSSQMPSNETEDTAENEMSNKVNTTNQQGLESEITNIDNLISDAVDKERLVTRSKVFWKKLAQRRRDIIELGKESGRPAAETPERRTQDHVISSDILLKQQKLLKATPKPKGDKDIWRSLAERKTEILKMSDNNKSKESKSNQLWNFIASKKNELLNIKRGVKSLSDVAGAKHGNHKSVTVLGNDSADSVPKPGNFQDSFQRELEERMRQRRKRQQTLQDNS